MDFLFGAMPECRIVPRGQPIARDDGIQREDIDALRVRQFPQHRIELLNRPVRRAGQPVFIVAKQRFEHRQQRLLNDLTPKRLPRPRPLGREILGDLSEPAIGRVRVPTGFDPRQQMMRVEREQHRRRTERMQRRGGVHQRLGVLTVIRRMRLDPQIPAHAAHANGRQQMIDGGRREHGEADRRRGGRGRRFGHQSLSPAIERAGFQRVDASPREAAQIGPRVDPRLGGGQRPRPG